MCVVGKCFVMFCVFYFPPGVYVGSLNLIASIPGPRDGLTEPEFDGDLVYKFKKLKAKNNFSF